MRVRAVALGVRTLDVSIRMGAVRMILLAIWTINLQHFLLAFEQHQFCPNTIFE